jgi:hypothetical protein
VFGLLLGAAWKTLAGSVPTLIQFLFVELRHWFFACYLTLATVKEATITTLLSQLQCELTSVPDNYATSDDKHSTIYMHLANMDQWKFRECVELSTAPWTYILNDMFVLSLVRTILSVVLGLFIFPVCGQCFALFVLGDVTFRTARFGTESGHYIAKVVRLQQSRCLRYYNLVVIVGVFALSIVGYRIVSIRGVSTENYAPLCLLLWAELASALGKSLGKPVSVDIDTDVFRDTKWAFGRGSLLSGKSCAAFCGDILIAKATDDTSGFRALVINKEQDISGLMNSITLLKIPRDSSENPSSSHHGPTAPAEIDAQIEDAGGKRGSRDAAYIGIFRC